jgi:hypothetical protein
MTRVVALLGAIALLALATLRAQDAGPPALLRGLLQSQRTWRLLDPRVDLPGAETTSPAQLSPTWIVADADRDGRDDVAAVVVSGSPNGRRFGVVAVHSATPRVPRWVTPLKTAPIYGLQTEPYADTIAVYYCDECDIRSWYRWGGRRYERQLFATGDDVALGDDHANGADLRTGPLETATKRAHVPPCADARVHDVGGRAGARWYFVETKAEPRARGWVTARAVIAQGDCF